MLNKSAVPEIALETATLLKMNISIILNKFTKNSGKPFLLNAFNDSFH